MIYRQHQSSLIARMTLAIIVLGSVVTLAVFWLARQAQWSSLNSEIEVSAARDANLISSRLEQSLSVVRALERFLATDEHFKGQEFFEFTIPYLRRQTEVRSLDWVPIVPSQNKEQVESEARRHIDPNFTIF